MRANTQRMAPRRPSRPTYRSLHGWAVATLIDHEVIAECDQHGHRRDTADPDAWTRAREEAWRNPYPGATPQACIAELEDVMRSIGDRCPDCDS